MVLKSQILKTYQTIAYSPKVDMYDATPIIKEMNDMEFGEFELHRLDISTRFEYEEEGDKYYKPLVSVKI